MTLYLFTPHADQIRKAPGCRTTLNRLNAHDADAVLFASDHDLFVFGHIYDLHPEDPSELSLADLKELQAVARTEIIIPDANA
jgi:hypothetical protein